MKKILVKIWLLWHIDEVITRIDKLLYDFSVFVIKLFYISNKNNK
jgi:hypothetical protein